MQENTKLMLKGIGFAVISLVLLWSSIFIVGLFYRFSVLVSAIVWLVIFNVVLITGFLALKNWYKVVKIALNNIRGKKDENKRIN